VIPFHIETLYQHEPWANWALVGATVITSLVLQSGVIAPDVAAHWFALGGSGPQALVGHLLAHKSLTALAANMLFLWVFGNAVCGTVGNLPFLALYLALGCVSGLLQLAVGGGPVAGASGAVAGLIGVGLVFFPVNIVSLYYPHWSSLRSWPAPLWILAPYWIGWNALGAWLHIAPSAYWGQLGGAAAGLGFGLATLATGLVQLTEFDNGSLLDVYRNRRMPAAERAAAAARAQLRQFARSYFAEYAALPSISVPTVTIGRRHRRRLTLRGSVAFAHSAAAPIPTAPRPSAQRPAPPAAAAVSVSRPSAWPAVLPDERYFYFDGATRHGPMGRATFLASLSLAADTTRWWYWARGMKDWQRVGALGFGLGSLSVTNKTGHAIGASRPIAHNLDRAAP
jgi:membrane associated rhomboid family serine protease